MPINDFEKFRKYAPISKESPLGIENSISLLVENAKKIRNKGVQLTLLADDERNPLVASTYGTGEVILNAVERAVRESNAGA